jgi:hypothetical protein
MQEVYPALFHQVPERRAPMRRQRIHVGGDQGEGVREGYGVLLLVLAEDDEFDIGYREVAEQIARLGPDAPVTYRSGVEPYSHAASKGLTPTVCPR